MLISVAVMAILGIVALAAALILNSGVIAWACIGLAAIGLILLAIDLLRERRSDAAREPSEPGQRHRTAGDGLFGEHDVERDLTREENPIDADMLGFDVPHEEAVEDLHASHGQHRHREPRR